jgi:Na+/proline symporter
LVRDVYQRYLRPQASDRQLVYASYAASLLFIVVGILISLAGESINRIFTWIMTALAAGVLLPNVLRWYWARFNGWGYFAGTITGMGLSLVQAVLEYHWGKSWPVYESFPVLALVVLVVAVVAAVLTPPVDMATLKRFYRDVQPAGAWRAVARAVREDDPAFRKEPFGIDLFNTVVGVVWLGLMYVAPVLLITHQMVEAAVAGGIVLVLTGVLAMTWWPNLPKAEAVRKEPFRGSCD